MRLQYPLLHFSCGLQIIHRFKHLRPMAVMILPSSDRQLQQICDNRIQVSNRLNKVSTTIKPVTIPDTNTIIKNTLQYTNEDASSGELMTSSSPLSGKPGCALVLGLGFYMIPFH